MYTDHTPDNDYQDFWTIALIRDPETRREVHFGVFTYEDAIKALDSGKIRVMEDQSLHLRRIRRFPK